MSKEVEKKSFDVSGFHSKALSKENFARLTLILGVDAAGLNDINDVITDVDDFREIDLETFLDQKVKLEHNGELTKLLIGNHDSSKKKNLLKINLFGFVNENGAQITDYVDAYRYIINLLWTQEKINDTQRKALLGEIKKLLAEHKKLIHISLDESSFQQNNSLQQVGSYIGTSTDFFETSSNSGIGSSSLNASPVNQNERNNQPLVPRITEEEFNANVTRNVSAEVRRLSESKSEEELDKLGITVVVAISLLGMFGGFSLVENSDETSEILLKIFSIPTLASAFYLSLQAYLSKKSK